MLDSPPFIVSLLLLCRVLARGRGGGGGGGNEGNDVGLAMALWGVNVLDSLFHRAVQCLAEGYLA